MIFNINQNTTKKEYRPNYLLAKLDSDVALSTNETKLSFIKVKSRKDTSIFIDGTKIELIDGVFNLDLKVYLTNKFDENAAVYFQLYDVTGSTKTLLSRFIWRASIANPYEHVNVKFPYIETTDTDTDNVYEITAKVSSGNGNITVGLGGIKDSYLLISALFDYDYI